MIVKDFGDIYEMATGNLIPEFSTEHVTCSFYGGVLCDATVNGENITDLFDIPEADGIDDELVYRITNEAADFIIQQINTDLNSVGN